MAQVKKAVPTLESVFFSTPEQKVMRFLLSEPTSTFTPRVISSKLKGVRGLGGAEGIMKILQLLETVGLVEFVDNRRSVRAKDENPSLKVLKIFSAICDLEGVRALVEPLSTKGVLFGDRSVGEANSDSTYELFIVSHNTEEVKKIVHRHPLGKQIELTTRNPDEYTSLEKNEPLLAQKLSRGLVVWGSSW